MTSLPSPSSHQNVKESLMGLLLILAIIVGGLVLLGALAASFGTDSRESIGDDWARPIRV
jgi:hypothetical protein